MGIITPGDVRDHHAALTSTAKDDLLERLIDRVDELMALWCGFPRTTDGRRTLGEATYLLRPPGPLADRRGIFLGVKPCIEIESAYVSGDWSFGSSDLLASTEYDLDTDTGILWLLPAATHEWLDDPRANKITVTAGHAVTPHGLIAITASAVAGVLRASTTDPNLLSASAGGQSVSMAAAKSLLSEQTRNDLGPFRILENLIA